MKESMFDLDSDLLTDKLDGKSPYRERLDKAASLCIRERWDEALAIYEAIVDEDYKCIDAYIGVLRVHSRDFTVFEGEQIEKDIRIVERTMVQFGAEPSDNQYANYIKARESHGQKASEEAKKAAEEAEIRRKEEEARRNEEVRRNHCIHLCHKGEWKDIVLESQEENRYFAKGLALQEGDVFKINLNGDWRGNSKIAYDELTSLNFKGDGSYDDNIVVRRSSSFDITVFKSRPEKSIEIGLSDPEEAKRQLEEIEEAKRKRAEEQKKEKERYEKEQALIKKYGLPFDENVTVLTREYITKIYHRNFIRVLEITIPPWVTKIDDRAFDGRENLHKVRFPNGLVSIGTSAFQRTNIWTVAFPKTLKTIGMDAFAYSPVLSVDFGNASVKIGDRAFAFCRSLRKINNLGSVTEIGETAFEECAILDEVILGPNIQKIGEGAFQYCEDLRKVIIECPNCQVGPDAFIGCNRVSEIVFRGTKDQFNTHFAESFYQYLESCTIRCNDGTLFWYRGKHDEE